jgi:hypothetical protein
LLVSGINNDSIFVMDNYRANELDRVLSAAEFAIKHESELGSEQVIAIKNSISSLRRYVKSIREFVTVIRFCGAAEGRPVIDVNHWQFKPDFTCPHCTTVVEHSPHISGKEARQKLIEAGIVKPGLFEFS